MSSGGQKVRRPRTAVYVKNGVILRSDDARMAKAEKDAEEVVREIMDDPAYKLGLYIENDGENTEEDDTIIATSTDNKPEKLDANGAKKQSLSIGKKLGPSKDVIEENAKTYQNKKVVGRTKEISVGKSVTAKDVQGEVLNKHFEKDEKGFHKGKAKPLVTGMKEEYAAKAEYSSTNAEANTLNADVTGVYTDVTAEASAKVTQAHATALKADVTGVKEGASAHATYNHTTVGVKAATVKATGIDAKVTAEAKAKTGVAVDIGNVEVTGAGSLGVEANVDARTGVVVGNVRAGIQGKTGVSINTRPAFFNVNAVIGPPNFNVGLDTGMNVGIPFMGGGGGTEGTGGITGQENNTDESNDGIAAGSQGERQGNEANGTGSRDGGGNSDGNQGWELSAEGANESGTPGNGANQGFGGGQEGGITGGGASQSDRLSGSGTNPEGGLAKGGANQGGGLSGSGENQGDVSNGGGRETNEDGGATDIGFYQNDSNVEPQGNGYWTQFAPDGDMYWVSLNGNDTGMHFGYGEDVEFYDGDIDPIAGDHHPKDKGSTSKGNAANTNKSNSVKGQSSINTKSKEVNKSISITYSSEHETKQKEGTLPQISPSPFLVQQDNLHTGYEPKQKTKEGIHLQPKQNGRSNSGKSQKYQLNLKTRNNHDITQGEVGDKYDHLLVNIVQKEVKSKIPKKKRSKEDEKKEKRPITPKVINRDTVKEKLIAMYKPQVQTEVSSSKGSSHATIRGTTKGHFNEESTTSRAKSAKKKKAFGDNKNIHGFHTLGTSSDKSLKKLGSNVYGFGS